MSAVNSLLDAVKQLPPRELNEFEDRLAKWKLDAASDAQLVRRTRQALPASDERRLRRFIPKSEAGELSGPERAEYRELARHAEQLNVERVKALAELARRWGKPLDVVMQEVAWDGKCSI